MATQVSSCNYALGYTTAEQERLIRQAALIAPITERFFREAGIAPGQRVLDLGSGVGDVAMLVARLVGPTGEVVGIEREASSIARAQARVADAGLNNVSFMQTDLNQIVSDRLFDAAVGRFILAWLPDAVAVLRSVSRLVRPDGVLAFLEAASAPSLSITTHLPLWSAAASFVPEIVRRCGGDPEIALAAFRVFAAAGLPAPTMHMEMLLGNGPELANWIYDLLCSVRPQIGLLGLSFEALGDFETLLERLQAEVSASKSAIAIPALVGAWCRKE
jgi:ubiquinone/menaquinone biosynthesis C-methylase UbiE